MNNWMERINNLPMGDALAYYEMHAKPVQSYAPPSFQEQHPQEFEWISTSTFEFAGKMRDVLKQWGGLTANQLAAVRRCMSYVKPETRRMVGTQCAAQEIARGPDLTKVPSGLYAVPNGGTRLKVKISRGTGRWQSFIFVTDGAEYGQQRQYGRQTPDGVYSGQLQEQLLAIARDPRAASAAYGQLTGTCGVCGRHLENEESVAAGIGPICAGRLGW